MCSPFLGGMILVILYQSGSEVPCWSQSPCHHQNMYVLQCISSVDTKLHCVISSSFLSRNISYMLQSHAPSSFILISEHSLFFYFCLRYAQNKFLQRPINVFYVIMSYLILFYLFLSYLILSNLIISDTISTKRVPLIITQNNATIDRSYCANRGCHDGEGGHYQYIIPLSPKFPIAYLTIRFRYTTKECVLDIEWCAQEHVDIIV